MQTHSGLDTCRRGIPYRNRRWRAAVARASPNPWDNVERARVLDLWKEHLDLLSDRALQDRDIDTWITKLQDSHVELMMAIADDVGYKFDRVVLRKGAYNPEAHGVEEHEQKQLRRLAIGVLEGRNPITMNVASFPIDEDAQSAQTELSRRLSELVSEGELKVRLSQPERTTSPPDEGAA